MEEQKWLQRSRSLWTGKSLPGTSLEEASAGAPAAGSRCYTRLEPQMHVCRRDDLFGITDNLISRAWGKITIRLGVVFCLLRAWFSSPEQRSRLFAAPRSGLNLSPKSPLFWTFLSSSRMLLWAASTASGPASILGCFPAWISGLSRSRIINGSGRIRPVSIPVSPIFQTGLELLVGG